MRATGGASGQPVMFATATITDNGVGDSNPADGFFDRPGWPGRASRCCYADQHTYLVRILLSGLLALFGMTRARRAQ